MITLLKRIRTLLGGAGTVVQTEDTAHVTGDLGYMLLAVRQDAAAALAADGDYIPLIVDANGRVHIAPAPANSGVDIGDVDVLTINGVAPQFDDTDKLATSVYGRDVAAGDVPLNASAAGDLEVDLQVAGQPLQLDDTDKLAVSLWGRQAAPGDQELMLNANNELYVQIRSGGQQSRVGGAPSDGYTVTNGWLDVRALMTAHNGGASATAADRWRSNTVLQTLLASAARTATATSPTQTNYNHRGFVLSVDVTARAAATTLTPSLEIQAAGGDWKTIWTAAAAIDTANGSYVYLFYPGVIASGAALYVEELDLTFGRTWRVVITHNDANSITYEVGAAMIL